MPVCVVLKDGSRHVGILTDCSDGKVILNGGPAGPVTHSTSRPLQQKDDRQRSKKGKRKAVPELKQTANTQALGYGPYGGFFGGRLIFDLALISFLFLLL
ncbi:hypothetical protein IJ21_41920 [Paenibacillus sp. 32O-W]|jgi:hypothetical protein|nr:hypothetical protein [Paenibacillus sp. 32O-W]ALS29576.1 hypothetical protein IJ21_41920 [Paenibacillus sp. 32O-W]